MLSSLQALIRLDIQATRRWLEKEAFWKSVITLVFLLLMIGVGSLIYYFARFYFSYLTTIETYGELTIGYVLRATILIITWVGILSSFISATSFLLSPNKTTDKLVTLPIDPLGIISWQIIKTLFLNISMFLITIFPLSLAYFSVKGISAPEVFFRSISVLLILSLLVESLGSSLAFIITNRLKKREGLLYLTGAIALFIGGTYFVYKIIFPPSLALLESVDIANFGNLFTNLPLMRNCFIAGSFSGILENGFGTHFLAISLVTGLFLCLSILIQRSLFISNWQQVRLSVPLPNLGLGSKQFFSLNLIKKDLLSILRNPKELAYAIFLFLMLLIFISLLTRGIEARVPTRFSDSAIVFSWFWLIFYSGTFIIRLVFPLMAKEGRTRWWLFTLPLKPSHIVETKLFASLIVSLPLFLVGFVEWTMGDVGTQNIYLLASGLIVIAWLSLALSLLGMIKPDYSLGDDPDRVSTGFSGILALVIVIFAGIALSFLIDASLKGFIAMADSLGLLFVGGIVTLIPLYISARKSTQEHTVEV